MNTQHAPTPHAPSQGLTLVELMVAVVVISLLLALAVPRWGAFVARNRVIAASNAFQGTLRLARTTAIERSTNVVVCASNASGTACGNDWTQGWLVFLDPKNNGLITDAQQRVRVQGALPGSLRFRTDPALLRFHFAGTGFPSNTTTFVLYSDPCQGQGARLIALSPSGKSSVAVSSCP